MVSGWLFALAGMNSARRLGLFSIGFSQSISSLPLAAWSKIVYRVAEQIELVQHVRLF